MYILLFPFRLALGVGRANIERSGYSKLDSYGVETELDQSVAFCCYALYIKKSSEKRVRILVFYAMPYIKKGLQLQP